MKPPTPSKPAAKTHKPALANTYTHKPKSLNTWSGGAAGSRSIDPGQTGLGGDAVKCHSDLGAVSSRGLLSTAGKRAATIRSDSYRLQHWRKRWWRIVSACATSSGGGGGGVRSMSHKFKTHKTFTSEEEILIWHFTSSFLSSDFCFPLGRLSAENGRRWMERERRRRRRSFSSTELILSFLFLKKHAPDTEKHQHDTCLLA